MNQSVIHTVSDPETGRVYTLEARFGEKEVEIDVLHKGVTKANVIIEVYNGKSQAVIANQLSLEETGGDDPQLVLLFAENE